MVDLRVAKQTARKLSAELDELEKSVAEAAAELRRIGLPATLVKHALVGKGDLRLPKSSDAAKSIYKSAEFRDFLNGVDAPICIKAPIRFRRTKHLHAAFLDATLFGDIDLMRGQVHFKGYLYDKFDFRKAKEAKVKSTYGKLLRGLGNTAKELQDAGVVTPFKVRVDLDFKMKHK